MKNVKDLKEIDFATGEKFSFLASVIEFHKADAEKKPSRILLCFEATGIFFNAVAWGLDESLKSAEKDGYVYSFEGAGNIFNKENQIKLLSLENTNKKSVRSAGTRKLSEKGIEDIKKEINREIGQIKNEFLRKMTYHFIFEDPRFFIWPAATSIHHAYPGGLALHSYSVCQAALKNWELYKGENMNRDLIVAGSLLHDIGKLEEYESDGKRTIIGDMIGHPVLGQNKIIEYCQSNERNIEDSNLLLSLCHIILSHHGKLEFGSPVIPGTLEARIISNADQEDAVVEIFLNKMSMMNPNSESEKILALDGKIIYLETEEE